MRHADLNPPLGKPGGPCQVVQRIDRQIQNPRLRDDLIDEVESGEDLSNAEASKVYGIDKEPGVGLIDAIVITAHGQYRMDLRGITVEDVRAAIGSFAKQMADWQKLGSPAYQRMLGLMQSGQKVEWLGKNRLKVVFEVRDSKAYLVTTFWKGMATPVPPKGGCPLPKRAAERVVLRFLTRP